MTSAELKALPREALERLWQELRADKLPVGTFDGKAFGVPAWPFWKGKVFTMRGWRGEVVNRIGPWLFIKGKVSLPAGAGEVLIDYPQLGGLQDRLKPVSQTLWLGRIALPRLGTVWFSLEKKP